MSAVQMHRSRTPRRRRPRAWKLIVAECIYNVDERVVVQTFPFAYFPSDTAAHEWFSHLYEDWRWRSVDDGEETSYLMAELERIF